MASNMQVTSQKLNSTSVLDGSRNIQKKSFISRNWDHKGAIIGLISAVAFGLIFGPLAAIASFFISAAIILVIKRNAQDSSNERQPAKEIAVQPSAEFVRGARELRTEETCRKNQEKIDFLMDKMKLNRE